MNLPVEPGPGKLTHFSPQKNILANLYGLSSQARNKTKQKQTNRPKKLLFLRD